MGSTAPIEQRSPGATTVNDVAEYGAAMAMLSRRFVEGNVEQAARILESVIARSPGFAAAHAGLASAYLTQFRETKSPEIVERSIATARRAVELDPSDPRGLTALALAYDAAGRSNEAIQTVRTALARQPRSDDLRRELGDILVGVGQFEPGLAELREAVRLRPDYWERRHWRWRSTHVAGSTRPLRRLLVPPS